MCTRSGEQGTASVEAALVLPFLLVLAVLAVDTTQFMLLKKANQLEARLTAWRHATLSAFCFSLPRRLEHGDLLSRYCSTNQGQARQFLGNLKHGQHETHKRELVRMVSEAGLPGAVTATAMASRAFGRPEAPAEHWMRVNLVDRHAVDAIPHWEYRDSPIGYDVHLKKVLDSDTIFPNYFPKVR